MIIDSSKNWLKVCSKPQILDEITTRCNNHPPLPTPPPILRCFENPLKKTEKRLKTVYVPAQQDIVRRVQTFQAVRQYIE